MMSEKLLRKSAWLLVLLMLIVCLGGCKKNDASNGQPVVKPAYDESKELVVVSALDDLAPLQNNDGIGVADG